MAKKVKKKAMQKPSSKTIVNSRTKSPVNVYTEDKAGPALSSILTLIKERTNVDLSGYKMSTIRRRVQRHMLLRKFKSLHELAKFLKTHPQELLDLYKDIFIHVTEFFRDPDVYRALEEKVLPEILKKKKAGETIRIWIPGCSTGEEVYSIAMLFMEAIEKRRLNLGLHIFATDICDGSIRKARQAVYPESALKNVGAKRGKKFFEKTKEGLKVTKKLREVCVFSEHDLINNPPFSKLDFISCRNVFIYFAPELQKKIIPIFNYALNPGGFLLLGSSESVGNSTKLFKVVDKKNRIFSKIESGKQVPMALKGQLQGGIDGIHRPKPMENFSKNDMLQRTAEQILLRKYAPPGVIVNEELEILNFQGKTYPYLQPPTGKPSNGLLKISHPDITAVLRLLFQSVRKSKVPIRKEGVKLKDGKNSKQVNIEVSALNPSAGEGERQYLFLFEEVKKRAKTGPKTIKVKSFDDYITEKQVDELTKELEVQREYFKAVHEQYDASQEELRSTNEELQASNEELQCSNEELETAKEELQSTNQDLVMLNRELESRNVELSQLNEKLVRSEERFRLIVESVKDYAIFMLDPSGNVASWNEGAKHFKGYEEDEIIGKHFSVFYTPEDIAQKRPEWEIEKALQTGRVEDEGWRVRKDGTRFWANVIITRMNDKKGNLIGFSKVTRDLTEKKKAEEELRASEEKFRLMVNTVKDYAIFMLDPEGYISSWNEGARRIKGYEASEIIGKHFSKFYLPEDIKRHHPEEELEIAKETGRYEEEALRVRKDGSTFWANVLITRVTDSNGKIVGFVKVTRDLSERKRHEEELKKAFQGLEERVKERTHDLEVALSTRDEFLSIASHELKTPLTSLKIHLQLSRRRLDNKKKPASPQDLERSLDISIKQVNSLSNLVEELLDVSRIQSGAFNLSVSTFNLSDLVEEIVSRFTQQLMDAGCTVELHLSPDVSGEWDRYRLEQVIVNLIFNAIKYAAGKPVKLYTSEKAGMANFVIEDFGPGIPKDKQQMIFERFERANGSRDISGLGLGLFITRKIVEAHHGKVHVESEVGKGAKFIVELPKKA